MIGAIFPLFNTSYLDRLFGLGGNNPPHPRGGRKTFKMNRRKELAISARRRARR